MNEKKLEKVLVWISSDILSTLRTESGLPLLSVNLCLFLGLGSDKPVVQVLVKSDSPCESHQFHLIYNHCKNLNLLNLSTCRKVLSLLKSITGLHLW